MDDETQIMSESAQRYIDAVAAAEKAGDEQFFFWFDASPSLDEYFEGGSRTLGNEILTPVVLGALGSIQDSSALEIAHSGGRILSRVLRPGGVAQLFYGRYSRMSWSARIRWSMSGYREIEARTNYTSLVVTKRVAHSIAREAGFNVLDSGSSLRPDGVTKGIQNYMTLQVPK